MNPIPNGSPQVSKKLSRIILLALEEVVGRGELTEVFNAVHLECWKESSPAHHSDVCMDTAAFSRMLSGLESVYGRQAGQGLALRVGRACFKHWLREFGAQYGCSEPSFRTQPLDERVKSAGLLFARILFEHSGESVRLEEGVGQYLLHVENCPVCFERSAESAVCRLGIGVIQEGLHWISGGKHFQAAETCCLAKGDPTCTFTFDKKPMD